MTNSHIASLPSIASLAICVVAVVASSAGENGVDAGTISGHLLLIVVVNDFRLFVFKQTAGARQ